jgi:hypothetical protein
VLLLAGCAHVDANYPEPRTATAAPELPEQHVHEGFYTNKKYTQLVWRQEGDIHGFLSYWEDAGVMATRMKRAADGRNPAAAKDAQRFQRMDDRGQCYLALWIYAAPEVEMLVRRGDLRIDFTDGTSTVNEDLYLYPVANRPEPFQSTANGAVLISGKADPDLEGRHFFIFMPEKWLAKKVASVTYVGP